MGVASGCRAVHAVRGLLGPEPDRSLCRRDGPRIVRDESQSRLIKTEMADIAAGGTSGGTGRAGAVGKAVGVPFSFSEPSKEQKN